MGLPTRLLYSKPAARHRSSSASSSIGPAGATERFVFAALVITRRPQAVAPPLRSLQSSHGQMPINSEMLCRLQMPPAAGGASAENGVSDRSHTSWNSVVYSPNRRVFTLTNMQHTTSPGIQHIKPAPSIRHCCPCSSQSAVSTVAQACKPHREQSVQEATSSAIRWASAT